MLLQSAWYVLFLLPFLEKLCIGLVWLCGLTLCQYNKEVPCYCAECAAAPTHLFCVPSNGLLKYYIIYRNMSSVSAFTSYYLLSFYFRYPHKQHKLNDIVSFQQTTADEDYAFLVLSYFMNANKRSSYHHIID